MPPDNEGPQTGTWFSTTNDDHIINYLVDNIWDQATQPESWQVARFSPAVYGFRDSVTEWAVVAKFYSVKTRHDAGRHAVREYEYTRQAWEALTPANEMRAVRPLGLWQGTLFLEYIAGLTLGDLIAVRRSQPGELAEVLEKLGKFLAGLHTSQFQSSNKGDFGLAADYAYKILDNLAQHGVLQDNPIAQNGVGRLIEKWVADPLMWDFETTLNHGDATTSNFIFSQDGEGVAVDWERSKYDDPAADLGRLVAEVTHTVDNQGGNIVEALDLTKKLTQAYCLSLPSDWNRDALLHRMRFYQAASTLRIARNGWLSRQERMALVVQAMALLS